MNGRGHEKTTKISEELDKLILSYQKYLMRKHQKLHK